MLSVVAARYARALVDVVTAPGSNTDPAQVLSQLRAVQDLIHGSPVLQHALASPAVAPSRKRAVMRRLLEPMGVGDKVRNFVYVVIDHRRGHEFASIVDAAG
jgi:F0F1-type ATP synthase delta subunit